MSIQGRMEGTGPILTRTTSRELDCETAALLRATILPLFTGAASWANLSEILKDKGYCLSFRKGSLCLTDQESGDRVCGMRFLGLDFKELVQRMGRPIVVARGNGADGDVLAARPTQGVS